MKINFSNSIVLSVLVLMAACNTTEYKKTPEGFPYKVFSSGKGEKIDSGNVVRYHITQKLEDSLLETTYGGNSLFIAIPKQDIQHPLAKLLLEARKGDSIKVIQPIDSLLSKEPRLAQDPLFTGNKGKNLITIIKVEEVYTDMNLAQEIFEKESIEGFNKQPDIIEQRKKDVAIIESYLQAKNIQTQKTPWGVYLQIINQGTGPKPKNGQVALVRYTGKDLQGNVFDTNEKPGAELLPIQLGAGGMIPGFVDAVRQLSKGGKAVAFIPSVVAYGAQGKPPTIQPHQNLIFEIELVDIKDQMPEAPTMQQRDSATK